MLALQASGHRIVNLACGWGRPADRDRRQAEALESSRRTGFELVIPSRQVAIGSGDDLEAAQAELATQIAELVRAEHVQIVFSPSPHDRHPGHEVVGRAALAALSRLRDPSPAWWMWGLWADLPFPTLIAYFGPERLRQILDALAAHAGELGRNDYRRLVRGRAEANAALGAERVFGFGAPGRPRGVRRAGNRGCPQGRGLASGHAEGARPRRAPGGAHAQLALRLARGSEPHSALWGAGPLDPGSTLNPGGSVRGAGVVTAGARHRQIGEDRGA